jgi:malate dehydrogenase (oxaloacetate-decarboxylating)
VSETVRHAVGSLSEKRSPIVVGDEEIFAAHVGGKLSVELKAPLDTQRALSIAYTPGVAQVSRAVAADHTLAARYTWANRLVADRIVPSPLDPRVAPAVAQAVAAASA